MKLFQLLTLFQFKGILFAKPDAIKTATDLVRLYLHESERVYCDKLVDKEDIDLFFKLQRDIVKKSLEVCLNLKLEFLGDKRISGFGTQKNFISFRRFIFFGKLRVLTPSNNQYLGA